VGYQLSKTNNKEKYCFLKKGLTFIADIPKSYFSTPRKTTSMGMQYYI